MTKENKKNEKQDPEESLEETSLLDELLGNDTEEQEDVDEEIVLPEKISIGIGALKKAYTICRLLKQVRGTSSEWYGLMISRKDTPEIIRDFYIGKQESGAAHTEIDGEEVGKLTDLIQKEKGKDWIVNGWIHSHGGLATFFSGTDDRNMEKVLQTVNLDTRKKFKKSYKLIEGKKNMEYDKDKKQLIMSSALEGDPEVKISLADGIEKLTEDEIKKMFKIKIREPVLAGWSYSIVVNDAGDREGHINYKEERPLKEEQRTWDQKAKIEVLKDDEYEIELDEKALKEEIKEKIKTPEPVVYITKHGKHGYEYTFPGQFDYRHGSGWKHDKVVVPTQFTSHDDEDDNDEVPQLEKEDIVKFFESMMNLYQVAHAGFFSYAERRALYETVTDAIIGGIDAHPSYTEWLEDRLEDGQIRGDYEGALYKLIIDPAIINCIKTHAEQDKDFAKMVYKFRKNQSNWKKKEAFEEYMDKTSSSTEKSTAKEEEKPDTDSDDDISELLGGTVG